MTRVPSWVLDVNLVTSLDRQPLSMYSESCHFLYDTLKCLSSETAVCGSGDVCFPCPAGTPL